MHPFFKIIFLLSFFLSGTISCSGGACGAGNSVLDDFDSDCIEDGSDNCLIEGDPDGSYNPEQFDGDEDGVGVPCDIDDTDDGVV